MGFVAIFRGVVVVVLYLPNGFSSSIGAKVYRAERGMYPFNQLGCAAWLTAKLSLPANPFTVLPSRYTGR